MSYLKLSKIAHAVALISTVALVAISSQNAMAAAPMVKIPAPGYFRMMLGAFEVTALSDGTIDLPVDKLLMEPTAKTTQLLSKSFLTAPLETSVNAYLINTGTKLVLIDAGTAGLFGPSLGKLLINLKASGYEPGQIDEVYLTHLHPDHVGGLISNGELAFPNATIRSDQREADVWLSQANMDKAPDAAKAFFQGAMASLNPYIAANKYKPFTANTELVPGVKSVASTGHTIGHTSYVVESQGQKLVLIGDLIHVAAVQLDHPEVTITFDSDAKEAAHAREQAFTQAVKDGAIVGASHIQFPGLGHLRSVGKGFQWIPVNYTQMR
ncbi:MAG: MBL fold metallo-hydrolase [Pseudomonadota bacterium]